MYCVDRAVGQTEPNVVGSEQKHLKGIRVFGVARLDDCAWSKPYMEPILSFP